MNIYLILLLLFTTNFGFVFTSTCMDKPSKQSSSLSSSSSSSTTSSLSQLEQIRREQAAKYAPRKEAFLKKNQEAALREEKRRLDECRKMKELELLIVQLKPYVNNLEKGKTIHDMRPSLQKIARLLGALKINLTEIKESGSNDLRKKAQYIFDVPIIILEKIQNSQFAKIPCTSDDRECLNAFLDVICGHADCQRIEVIFEDREADWDATLIKQMHYEEVQSIVADRVIHPYDGSDEELQLALLISQMEM